MPSQADVEQYRQANSDIVTLAQAQLVAFWATLDLSDPPSVAGALRTFLPNLIDTFGNVAAVVAADFYDTLRADAPAAASSFTAVLTDTVPDEQIQGSIGWSLSPLFPGTEPMQETGFPRDIPPDPDAALGRFEGAVQRLTLQPGRDTIATSVEQDPDGARWARIPTGAETCAFCRVMASRGADYGSFESAGAKKLPDGSNPHAYHDDCDCVATPFWDGDEYPEGYDPDALLQQYTDARDAADTGRLKGKDSILSALREQQGIS